MSIYKSWTKIVVDLSIGTGDSCPVLEIVKISCQNGIKVKSKAINVFAHLESKLSTYSHYAVDNTEIANLEKLTALSEKAVSLISGNYSLYSKV